MIGEYYYNEQLDKLFVYKKITVAELLYLKTKYKHIEVREPRKRSKW